MDRVRLRRVVGRGLAGMLAVAGLGGAAWIAGTEPAPPVSPWVTPTPTYAARHGYDRFRSGAGRAIPGLAEARLARNPPVATGPLLVDHVHSTKQPIDDDLGLDDYGYLGMHGFARAMRAVRGAGIRVETVEERWSAGRLGGAAGVFVNLVSGNNPGFSWAEVRALDAFVRAGGGLVLLTEHSNCYFHAEVLQRLTDRLGVVVPPVTAADRGPGHTLSRASNAWIRAVPTGSHPVVDGVAAVGWMTGGVVRGGTPLVTTSAEGWEDRWDPARRDDSAGFTGDLKPQADEAPGPSTLVAAFEHGAGRVVVLTDQNAFGATMLGYEDNRRLFANAVAWTTGRAVPVVSRGPDSVVTLDGPRSLCTAAARFGYRTLQVQLQRLATSAGIEEFCTREGETAARRLLVLPEADRADLAVQITRASRVLVVVDPAAPAWLLAVGLLPGPPAPPATGVRGLDLLPHPRQRAFRGTVPVVEPVEVAPLPFGGAPRVVLSDLAGRPVVVEETLGAATVRFVLDPALLANGRLGAERDLPDDGARGGALRIALTLLAWLTG